MPFQSDVRGMSCSLWSAAHLTMFWCSMSSRCNVLRLFGPADIMSLWHQAGTALYHFHWHEAFQQEQIQTVHVANHQTELIQMHCRCHANWSCVICFVSLQLHSRWQWWVCIVQLGQTIVIRRMCSRNKDTWHWNCYTVQLNCYDRMCHQQ